MPSLDALLVSGKTAEADVVLAADLATGRRLRALAVPTGGVRSILGEPVLFDTESTLVATSGASLTRHDLGTGAIAWSSPELIVGKRKACGMLSDPGSKKNSIQSAKPHLMSGLLPGLPSGRESQKRRDTRPLEPPAPMMISSEGRYIFAFDRGALHAVEAQDGRLLWREPPELCGRCVEVIEVSNGMLVRTMPELCGNDELVMLDGPTGSVLWQYPPPDKGAKSVLKSLVTQDVQLSNPIVEGGAAYVLAGKDLMRIELATGESSKVGRTRIEELSVRMQLERDSEGFLITGGQELEWLDGHGQSTRHVHYSPPADRGLGMLMMGAAMSANAFGSQHVGNGTLSMKGSYGPGMERFMRQHHATSNVDSLVFMLADLDEAGIEGTALVAIDKRTGTTVQRIAVSKKPNYMIDTRLGWIIIVDKKTIRGHGL